jgi:PEP-CTERM motif
LSNRPEAKSDKTELRRRPTRRHRRNRLIRRGILLVFAAGLAFGVASIALQRLSPSLFRTSNSREPGRQAAEASRHLFLLAQQESLRQMENRPVYPYSVVPGGVRDARELKWAAQHDPVVAAHYAGFDYDRGRVVRLVLARTAYVSYRIGNKVYWTRHRLKLKKGETVVTDGKITVRSRCGNRVEEVPQQEASALEPPAVKFDEPMIPALGIASSNPPVPFESALNQAGPSLGPAMPLSVVDPFENGTWVPITPPPLPGVCGIEKKSKNTTETTKKGKVNPCAPGSIGEVPEPGTWLLVVSGLAAMYWMSRKSRHALSRA